MIKIDNTEVYGWEAAIRGMRNPLNSWDKSDTDFSLSGIQSVNGFLVPTIGDNDLDLMKRLVFAGEDHSKFMRMINVACDIIAPLYWWKEYDTYKVGTVANSCSTMHKIHAKEFTVDDFSFERTVPICSWFITSVLNVLNAARERYLETKDKMHWDTMIQFLPSSYNQKRTVQLNYAVLRNMYHSRKNHKLDEWRDFCKWVESLPYAEALICGAQMKGAEK